jgi:hypothetical protein
VVLFLAFSALAPAASRGAFALPSTLLYLGFLLVGIFAHEAIHGLAWALFGRLPLRRIRFGFKLMTLTPYAHALDPLPAGAYRLGALLPAILLGVVPFVAGTLIGSLPLALFGMLFILAAGGDLLVLWLIRGVDPQALVLDHPSRAGCIVLHPSIDREPDPAHTAH